MVPHLGQTRVQLVSDVVPVYRFDDGAVIERVLSNAAMQARMPPLDPETAPTWSRAVPGIYRHQRDAEELADDERVAMYILRLPGQATAHSIGSVLVRLQSLTGSSLYLDLDRLDHKEGEERLNRLSRSYWRPFIEDTMWEIDEDHIYWGGFYIPSFVDDRVYERLANPPDGLDQQVEARHQEMLVLEEDLKDQLQAGATLNAKIVAETHRWTNDQWVDAALKWLLYAFSDEDMKGIAGTMPTSEQYADKPDQWNYDGTPLLRFELGAWLNTDDGSDRFAELTQFYAVREENDRGIKELFWKIYTNGGDLLSTGSTPVEALQNAENKWFAVDQDNVDMDNILPSSRRDAWYAENYKAGTPTFDMEVFYLLDIHGPVLRPNSWFRVWAKQEFSS